MSSSGPRVSVIPPYIAEGRFSTVSDDNHAAPIWISTLLCLVYSTLVLIIRAHLKLNAFSLDDYIILLATILQTGEAVALIVALQHGLGQSYHLLTAAQIYTTNRATFASIILFIASTCFAKISVIALMMRLFNLSGPRANADARSRILWFAFLAVTVVTVLWGILSIIALSVNCSISSFITNDSCPAQPLRWNIIGSIDISTEVLLVLLALVTAWPVQLKIAIKIPIVIAFMFRLPCVGLSALHIYYVHGYTAPPTTPILRPGLSIVPVLILMQIQLWWSILSATIPNLKSFVRSFNGGFGHHLDLDSMSTSKFGNNFSSSGSRSRSTTANRASVQEHELEQVKTSRRTSHTTTLQAFGRIPRRPSRKNVDIEGIGLHAGIPAVPGFGASRYVSRVEVGTGLSPDLRGDSIVGSENGRSPRLDNGSVDGVASGSVDSREGIIRKDMRFEVRYELA